MKRYYFTVLIIILVLGLFLLSVSAEVPETNRMKIGNISSILPEKEMNEHYAKMEPIMLQYFGPPFSDFNLKIKADPTKGYEATGFAPEGKTLILAGQAKEYLRLKQQDQDAALEYLYSSMHHELSHSMYIYGNEQVIFGNVSWIGEGWAKCLEEKINEQLNNKTMSYAVEPYYYMPKDIVAGIEGWGDSKPTAGRLAYGMTTSVHYLLLAAASKEDMDFYKKMNNAIYDKIKSGLNPAMSFEDYKSIIKPLLAGVKVDGEDAYEWYFNNPAAYTEGSSGPHIGAFLLGGNIENRREIEVISFNRDENSGRRFETALPNTLIKVKLEDSQGNIIFENSTITNNNGEGKIDISSQIENGAYMVRAESTINSKKIEMNMFGIITSNIRPVKGRVYGVLLNENGELVNGNYVSLLNVTGNFVYKKNGLFVFDSYNKTAILDFLGKKQEVTIGNFERVFAFTVPKEYIEKAIEKSQEELIRGIIEYSRSKDEANNAPTPPVSICGDGVCNNDEKTGSKYCEQDCGKSDEQLTPDSKCGDGSCDDVEKSGRYYCEQDCGKIPKKSGFFYKISSWFRNIFKKS